MSIRVPESLCDCRQGKLKTWEPQINTNEHEGGGGFQQGEVRFGSGLRDVRDWRDSRCRCGVSAEDLRGLFIRHDDHQVGGDVGFSSYEGRVEHDGGEAAGSEQLLVVVIRVGLA